jgi:signal peptidase I
MSPTFRDGDWILVELGTFNIQKNAVYIVELEPKHYIIKRCASIISYIDSCHNSIYKSYLFLGDNLDCSIDSRSFGGVSSEHIKGRVNRILWRRRENGKNYADESIRKDFS